MTKKEISTEEAPAAVGPYSQGIDLGNLVFTSGQIPFNTKGKLVSDDIQEQTKQGLKNLEQVLKEAGCSMDDVFKCTVFISNMDDFPKVNEVYEKFFTKPYPARSCVEVARLPKDVKIEIEAIALKE